MIPKGFLSLSLSYQCLSECFLHKVINKTHCSTGGNSEYGLHHTQTPSRHMLLLTKPERQYCVTHRELLTVVTFIQQYRPYLVCRRFTLRTDHGSLTWLRNFKEPEGQLARWLERLQELDFEVVHRRGTAHGNADSLSRLPCRQCGRTSHDTTTRAEISALTLQLPPSQASDSLRQLQLADTTLAPLKPGPECFAATIKSVRSLLQLWDQLVGTNKTLGRLKELFYWPGHYNDVREWCRNCATCAQLKSPTTKPRAPLTSVVTSSPLQLVATDTLGPLPESSSGNSYILVVADYFTRYTETYPIPNQEATTVASKLVDEFFLRFSPPEQLHSDQGQNFESSVISEVCKLLGIRSPEPLHIIHNPTASWSVLIGPSWLCWPQRRATSRLNGNSTCVVSAMPTTQVFTPPSDSHRSF